MIHIQTGIENMIAPQNKGDAGIDIIASKNPVISGEIWHGAWYKNISYIEYDTDIRMSQLKPYLNIAYYSLGQVLVNTTSH